MPSADFCTAVRPPYDSPPKDTVQISRSKPDSLHRTPAGFTVLALDGYGLCDILPARPTSAASYPVSVRQVATLLHASFRRSLTVLPLRFASASPPSGCTGDFTPRLPDMSDTQDAARRLRRCRRLRDDILDCRCARRSARRQVGTKGWSFPIEQRDTAIDLKTHQRPLYMINLLNLTHTTGARQGGRENPRSAAGKPARNSARGKVGS